MRGRPGASLSCEDVSRGTYQKLQFVLEALDINQQYTLAGMLENFAGKKVVRSRMNSLQGNP